LFFSFFSPSLTQQQRFVPLHSPHMEESQSYVRFEVLTAVVMKSIIFCDITPCSPLKVNRRFGGTYRLHLQGRKISRARNQREIRWQAEALLARLIFRPWRWRGRIPLERRLTFDGLHGVISQKMALFSLGLNALEGGSVSGKTTPTTWTNSKNVLRKIEITTMKTQTPKFSKKCTTG
jgi:hypothetical protein